MLSPYHIYAIQQKVGCYLRPSIPRAWLRSGSYLILLAVWCVFYTKRAAASVNISSSLGSYSTGLYMSTKSVNKPITASSRWYGHQLHLQAYCLRTTKLKNLR